MSLLRANNHSMARWRTVYQTLDWRYDTELKQATVHRACRIKQRRVMDQLEKWRLKERCQRRTNTLRRRLTY